MVGTEPSQELVDFVKELIADVVWILTRASKTAYDKFMAGDIHGFVNESVLIVKKVWADNAEVFDKYKQENKIKLYTELWRRGIAPRIVSLLAMHGVRSATLSSGNSRFVFGYTVVVSEPEGHWDEGRVMTATLWFNLTDSGKEIVIRYNVGFDNAG